MNGSIANVKFDKRRAENIRKAKDEGAHERESRLITCKNKNLYLGGTGKSFLGPYIACY